MAPKGKGKGKGRSKSPGKGKGKGKKKEPLTDEQKRKIAEQKALAEHEKLIRRQNLTKAFLKVKKDKEYELIKLNNNKLLDLWRPHLRKQKIKELLEDYRMMQLSFERAYDKKTGLIHDLERTMEQNGQEYDQAVDMHMYNIDKLMEFYRRRVKEVQINYSVQRQKLIDSLNGERSYIENEQKRSINELRNAMANMEANYEAQSLEKRMELFMKEEDLRNTETQELYVFRNIIESQINNCWKDIHDKILSYSEASTGKRKELVKFMERDEKLSAVIATQFERLHILGDGIKELNLRSALFTKAYGKYIEDLVEKKAACREVYEGLMASNKTYTFTSKSSFANLAVISHDILAKMDALVVRREQIMRSCERLRKLEFLEDKIDPFLKRWKFDIYEDDDGDVLAPATKKRDEESSDDAVLSKFFFRVGGVYHHFNCDCNPCTCELESEGKTGLNAPVKTLINNYSMLERFWARFNKAALERQAVMVKRNALLKDNNKLRISLRNYMGGLNPPALDVIQYSNELVEKNKRMFRRFAHAMELEMQRRERCRKVGGIKVH